jgi:hypothetical protein
MDYRVQFLLLPRIFLLYAFHINFLHWSIAIGKGYIKKDQQNLIVLRRDKGCRSMVFGFKDFVAGPELSERKTLRHRLILIIDLNKIQTIYHHLNCSVLFCSCSHITNSCYLLKFNWYGLTTYLLSYLYRCMRIRSYSTQWTNWNAFSFVQKGWGKQSLALARIWVMNLATMKSRRPKKRGKFT